MTIDELVEKADFPLVQRQLGGEDFEKKGYSLTLRWGFAGSQPTETAHFVLNIPGNNLEGFPNTIKVGTVDVPVVVKGGLQKPVQIGAF